MFDGRPRRSVLYMPGSNRRALDKARTLPADGLMLDLEGAVIPTAKLTARHQVAAAVREGGYGLREVVVRVNGLDTEWVSEDLAMVADVHPDAVLVPKVDSADMVREVEVRLLQAGAPDDLKVWAMIETPLGMLNAASIAAASPRLACFVMGTNDLVNDLGARHTPDRLPVLTGLGLCILAARAHELAILDGVYNAVRDQDQLRAECQQGRVMGFDGKTLIHPSQIAVANEVFAPSADEIAEAERQVRGFTEAAAAGKGVAVVDGRIVENLHVESARALLARADRIREMGGESRATAGL